MRQIPNAQAIRACALMVLFSIELWPEHALAHAFGPRYALPLPLWLFVGTAGMLVGVSFLMMGLFVSKGIAGIPSHHRVLRTTVCGRWLMRFPVKAALQSVSCILFVLVLATGLLGSTDMLTNFSTVFVWIVWWTGMVFVQAFVGDMWAVVNPWSVLYDCAAWVKSHIGHRSDPLHSRNYPQWLGYWPAVLLFLIFTWLENVSMSANQPAVLASLVIAYSIITWFGMIVYGKETWLRHGEVFNVVFGLIARFGPIGRKTAATESQWEFRPYAIGLLTSKAVHGSLVVLVVVLLASVSFDGFEETSVWIELQEDIQTANWLKPYRPVLINLGLDVRAVIKTFALLATSALFLLAFVLISAISDHFGGKSLMRGGGLYYFVLTLVPIAIAYHIAHYLSYFLIAGQVIIPLLSDPFGYGWDLFGTAAYQINVTIVNVKSVWYTAIISIVLGHVAAVYLAHFMALLLFNCRKAALCSQIPMMVLMVGYTMTSLWILAQPIVVG